MLVSQVLDKRISTLLWYKSVLKRLSSPLCRPMPYDNPTHSFENRTITRDKLGSHRKPLKCRKFVNTEQILRIREYMKMKCSKKVLHSTKNLGSSAYTQHWVLYTVYLDIIATETYSKLLHSRK